ncbi:MAG: acetyl-CoA carboxylase, carboxyltransferase subunit beta [Lachnospiraceae bacterium]|uniref:Acetyl-coenzyme A carboxylase carboxyl transferase subunit beta n=1 Tax=Candidatus Weimeria bifida TaxID=2599074 RepID=A0A6N7J183_9FIRM|nr:acetyl-CoA carboxylase, carboxyltransferase subunit beta [Candidatus Weimeria bifida]RRF96536.1 MAG: acetyl-CoA carboxylase, carboxyltransferase subunit beta [Lachnospiraceae bacterium]
MTEEYIDTDPFEMCKGCHRRSRRSQWESHYYVCPVCGKYKNVSAGYRFSLIFDNKSFKVINRGITSDDPLNFPGYKEKLRSVKERTHLNETAVAAVGKISGVKTVAVVLDSRFFMGSMSQAAGERITRAIEAADKHKLPLVIFSASGGARMQEGMFSLWQMAKTADAVEEFSRNGGLYISVLTHPTTGGVTASFATLGDITLAEPGALIGFAGPRVIEQTIGKKLPKGFQRAEYLYQHGFVDAIVERSELKKTLTKLLMLHGCKVTGGTPW